MTTTELRHPAGASYLRRSRSRVAYDAGGAARRRARTARSAERAARAVIYRDLGRDTRYAGDDEPTPLYDEHARAAIVIEPAATARRFRTAFVLFAFVRYFLWAAFAKLTRRYDPDTGAVRLREVFEQLGGIWIKLGQILSLRTDVFSPEMARELAKLQDRAKGFDPAAARAILERELSIPFEFVFRSFDPLPFAAASISQVHRAVLRDRDQDVVVKIMRPEARRSFARDLAFLKRVASFFDRFSPYLGLNDALYELEQIMIEETDYGYEAANLRRMRKNLKAHGLIVPRVFRKYSTRDVLVMEEIHGVLMTDFIRAQQHDPHRLANWLVENKIKPKRIAYKLVVSILRQVMEDNLFHADMHPGNIMLLRGNKIALIDFGTIGNLEPEFRSLYMLFNRAVVTKEYRRAADYLIAMCPTIATSDLLTLQEELTRYYRHWEQRTHLAHVPYFEKALTAASAESGRILQRHKLQPSWALMRISRTFGTLDASLAFLIPNGNLLKIYAAYFEDRRKRTSNFAYVMKEVREKLDGVLMLAQETQTIYLPNVRLRALAVRGTINRVSRMWDAVLTVLKRGFDFAMTVGIGFLLWQAWPALVQLVRHFSFGLAEDDATHVPQSDWELIGLLVAALVVRALVLAVRRQLRARAVKS